MVVTAVLWPKRSAIWTTRCWCAGATGNVTVAFVVNERGLVTNAKVKKSTNAKFNKAAIEAVEGKSG